MVQAVGQPRKRERGGRGSEKEGKVSNPLYSHKPTGYASKIPLLLTTFFGLSLKIMKKFGYDIFDTVNKGTTVHQLIVIS